MKRRLLLLALASMPVMAVAARISTRGAGKAGGPLDPRRQDGTLGNDDKDQAEPEKSEGNAESEEGKTEASSQKESSD